MTTLAELLSQEKASELIALRLQLGQHQSAAARRAAVQRRDGDRATDGDRAKERLAMARHSQPARLPDTPTGRQRSDLQRFPCDPAASRAARTVFLRPQHPGGVQG